MADRPTIAIVTALKEELESILESARDVRRRDDGLFQARFGAAQLWLTATGDGASNAGRQAGRLCDRVSPAALVGAGVAGALSSNLEIGDMVVGMRVRDVSGEAPAPDPRLLGWALSSGAKAATLLTVDGPVVSSSKKALLAASLGADTTAAVDMESAAWARSAAARRIPHVIVRSISDRADEELPEYLERCVGDDGQVSRAAVVGRGLARPATLPALFRMRQRMYQCARILGTFLESFLAGAP